MGKARRLIDSDLYRYIGGSDILKKIRYILFTPGFRYTYFMRHASCASNIASKIFWKFLMRRCMLKYHIQIPEKTQIGAGFRISHFCHIGINGGAIIGKNFTIAPGAHVSYANGKREGVPKIGDNVILNINSVIVGNVNIGDNVLVGPNTFINFDVPDNSIVIGSPGKIIPRDSSPTAKYIVYAVE